MAAVRANAEHHSQQLIDELAPAWPEGYTPGPSVDVKSF